MKFTRLATAMFAVALLTLALSTGQAFASPSAETTNAPTAAPTPYQFRVEPNQTFRVTVRGYCIDFGKTFPTGSLELEAGTDARLSSALAYAFEKGYADQNFKQTGLAIYYLRANTWRDSDLGESNHDVAQEIVNNAQTSYTDPNISQASSLIEAARANQVQARIENFRAIDNQTSGSNFYGEGELVVTNMSGTALNLYLPFGTIGPAQSATFQNMLLYASGPAINAPAAPNTGGGPAAGSDTLPSTGSGGPEIGLLLIILSLSLVGVGLALRQRRTA